MYYISVAGPAESQKKRGCKIVRKYEGKSLIGPLDSNRVIWVANASTPAASPVPPALLSTYVSTYSKKNKLNVFLALPLLACILQSNANHCYFCIYLARNTIVSLTYSVDWRKLLETQ